MAESMTRNYAGMSKEERIQRRRHLLIESAMALSDEMGWHQITVERLCQAAQLNKRYFYESFADIEQLACAVVEQVASDIMLTVNAKIQMKQPIPQMAFTVIDTFVRYIIAVPSRAKLIFGDLTQSERLIAYRKHFIQSIVNEVTRHAKEIHQAHDVKNSLLENSALFLVGGTGQVILHWLEAAEKNPIEQLVHDLTTLWLITGDGAAVYGKQLKAF